MTEARYCRYCAYCFGGDCYYCSHKDKVLKRVDVQTQCKDFVASLLGDVDTGKPYKPRVRTAYQGQEYDQLNFYKRDEK